MKIIDGGVTTPKGFQAAGLCAGIKKDKKDMAMIYSTTPCTTAGVFTTNMVKAAPVKWDKLVVDTSSYAQAVVVWPMPVPVRKAMVIARRWQH